MQVTATELSRRSVWIGRVLSAIIVLLLIMDRVVKFLKPAPVIETFAHLDLPLGLATPVGVICLACTLLYAIPRTAVFGAVLLTGYLGGAIVVNLRVGDPLFSHALFPVYVGAIIWIGLYLRDVRVRALL
jgi:hypothetical protein